MPVAAFSQGASSVQSTPGAAFFVFSAAPAAGSGPPTTPSAPPAIAAGENVASLGPSSKIDAETAAPRGLAAAAALAFAAARTEASVAAAASFSWPAPAALSRRVAAFWAAVGLTRCKGPTRSRGGEVFSVMALTVEDKPPLVNPLADRRLLAALRCAPKPFSPWPALFSGPPAQCGNTGRPRRL